MPNIIKSIYNIRFLDVLASKKTIIHNLNPISKLLVTTIYILIVLSFDKYDISGLIPFVFYPMVIFTLSELPFFQIFKRTLIVLPIIIGIGIFNPFIDTTPYTVVEGISISAGWISFLSLLIKCSLTVLAGLLLIATTGIEKISSALRKLFVPKIFVTQLLLTYRYIYILLEEVARIVKAYYLRAPMDKGVRLKVSGSLLGQMLLRSFDRADRVYNAMMLRGFNGEYTFGNDNKTNIKSILYLVLWTTFFITARLLNIPETLGRFITGG
ncbi:MAG: cobalt ECF transporter T component CbiQ [Clostridiaceae bacterium]